MGKPDKVEPLDIDGQTLVNGGEAGFGGTMIIVSVPEQNALSSAS